MSTEAKAVSKAEEPKMCTKKEQIGHAIGRPQKILCNRRSSTV